jgi:hypothetical protein
MNQPVQPWHVPVRLEDVPETGLHLDLVADAQVRTGLAALSGVTDIPRLEAALEPLQNELDEQMDVIFAPSASDFAVAELEAKDLAEDASFREPLEVLSEGTADVGAIAAEFLLLGIDPYPRKPGAEFKPPAELGGAVSPFAALAKLKNGKD